ncbi:MAG TPA: YggS family pyridoxal phosphate-dependent enzyme [candidate division Zixibacteria bacterium]|nr:YggS family pyridoxal phosphate-dependent enzyme [candidate division Zixibacteria bacterium]
MNIKENISKLRDEISAHCAKIGRNESEITVVAASKYVGAEGIAEAYSAGIKDFGENRIQDAEEKMARLEGDITWHMIGHLQSNKAAKAVGAFDLIHSVDSEKLAMRIDRLAGERGIVQSILLEVNVADEDSKYGLTPPRARELFAKVFPLENINLLGLMTMAPLTDDESLIRGTFRGLRELQDHIQSDLGIIIPIVSMGMTNDWRIALEEGATHLRIGSAIFRG